jgi:hypothetical protein
MKKPTWFRTIDFITIGGGGVVSLGLMAYALIHGVEGKHATEGLILLAVVGIAFLAVWVVFALQRRKWLHQFRWIPEYGFMVNCGGYLLPDSEKFNAAVQRVIAMWFPYHPTARGIVLSEVNWLWFSKTLNETVSPIATRLCKGLTISATRTMIVDYDNTDDDLSKTAFAHELGHLIRGTATAQWSQSEHHKFAADHGLA